MSDRDAAWTFVVPTQTLLEIVSSSDVVPLDVAAAAKNVDEPATGALHEGPTRAGFGPASLVRLRLRIFRLVGFEELLKEVRLRSLRELRRDRLRMLVNSLLGTSAAKRPT